MTNIFWNYYEEGDKDWLGLLSDAPIPALSDIAKQRTIVTDGHFLNCPAFIAYYKNTYAIRSPIDINITYDADTKFLQVSPQRQSFFNEHIAHRGDVIGEDDPFLMSLYLGLLFIADKDCTIELLPAFMHDSEFVNKTRLIVGAFNIHRWYRPLELAFEFKSKSDTIKIKRGDVLAYVRFIPVDESKVSLIREEFSKKVLAAVESCTRVKQSMEKLPLKTLYKLTEKLGIRLKKKCPFNWGAK